MFWIHFSYSAFKVPFFYGLLGFLQFSSLVWNTATVYIRFLLLVVSKLWLKLTSEVHFYKFMC